MVDPSPSDADVSDLAHADIGIVCALSRETAPLLERCERVRKYTGGDFVFRGGRYDDIRVAVVESGMGFARARRATLALIEAHTPAWVLSCGYSGGLRPEIKVGDIVMADSIVDTHGQQLALDLNMPTEGQSKLFTGRFVTTDDMVRSVAEKQELAQRHDAIAVDMESLAVAQVCRESGMRFLAVRVISDDLSTDLPPEVLSVFGSSGSMRLGAIAGSLWKRPSSVKDLWRLREQANLAAARLATFLDGVLAQLHKAAD